VLCLLKDWIQYEEVSSEDALPSDETDGFNSSLYATKSSLQDDLANYPNVVICPQASGDENEDVSCDNLLPCHYHYVDTVLSFFERKQWTLSCFFRVVTLGFYLLAVYIC